MAGNKDKKNAAVVIGELVGLLGKLCLPLGLGIIAGYYLADQEIRFIPTVLEIALALFIFGSISVPLGRILRGRAFHVSKEERKIRIRIVVFAALASIAVIARLVLFWTEEPSDLTELSEDEFLLAYDIDSSRFQELKISIENSVSSLEESNSLQIQNYGVLNPEQERDVLNAWISIYNTSFALDQIRVFFEDWYRFDISRMERRFLIPSFLLSFASEVTLYEMSLRAVKSIENNPNAVKFLDAPHPDLGLAASSFSRFRQEMLGSRDEAMVIAGEQYLKFLETGFNGKKEAKSLGVMWLWKEIEEGLEAIEERAPIDKAALGLEADFQAIERATRRNWFIAQKSVADWMGDTRVRRIGTYLITPEQQEAMDRELEPGDILLSRKNWYLSNVGLPGFWPHAILYLGEPKKFKSYFDMEEVFTFIEQETGSARSLGDYLAEKSPRAWENYLEGDGEESFRVLEAVSEGVIFNTLAHASGDYMAAMRPELSKMAKAQAIIKAFGHVGKPYDFDFDFATDHALVCTELVWRSYRPEEGKEGIKFPLAKVFGRETLPANNIAKAFAEGRNKSNPPLSFVYFLDANEEERKAFVSSEEELAKTHLRTKWDLALP